MRDFAAETSNRRPEHHAPPLAAAEPDGAEDDLFIENVRVPRSLDPGTVPDPWPVRRPRLARAGVVGIWGRLVIAASAAAIAALFAVGKLSPPGSAGENDRPADSSSFGSRFAGQLARLQDPPNAATQAGNLEPQSAVPSATALAAPAPTEMPGGSTAAVDPRAAMPPPDPDSDEVRALVKRGMDFATAGDIAAARLLLERAAEAHNAQAALALGATYDPIVLEKLGVYGVVADIATARGWYEKAREFGSPEAPKRLDLLASRDH